MTDIGMVWHDEPARWEQTGHLDQGPCWCPDCIAATEIQPVPTVPELVKLDPAYGWAVSWDKDGKPTKWHLTVAGYNHLGAIMAHNARIRIARGEGDWVQPPSRTDLGGGQDAP